ncbi:uncharacterized protein LOC125019530 [Mugil cephalus]|uniref:uncharacterized protein LOC125019530 n=1 Tax=Mugil cephalus TaxID=48193 RepID=UPI001FB5A02A|nr:uncharacterized protein LOC125019530 [Mugil cephalus]
MSPARTELEEALCRYMTHALIYINILRGFCEGFSIWKDWRDEEINSMKVIKDRADELKFSHVRESEDKGKAFQKYMKSNLRHVFADRCEELRQELGGVLKKTLEGLEKLDCFLDAVERLAVTSPHIFMENQVLRLPEDFRHVQVVITGARQVCPRLLEFKRDAKDFFTPKLQNVDVLIYQLGKYVQTTQEICEELEKRCLKVFGLKLTNKPVIDMNVDLSEEEIQRMLHHINHLREIREDQNFRTVFLFQDVSCSDFIHEFNERQPSMLQFLEKLEEAAVQLDKMKKGSKISSVTGSSVGAVAGVLSIVGLALIPVTAGVSSALIISGLALGVTSGVNSIVTTATEGAVNYKQQNKADDVYQSFMEDVKCLQDCLEEATTQPIPSLEASTLDGALPAVKIVLNVPSIGKAVDSIVDAASAVKLVALDRALFIGANALFIGMDIFFICKDSVSLSKGAKSEVSQFIRARAELWSSEMESWKKIRDCLDKGLQTSEEKRAVLEKPFYHLGNSLNLVTPKLKSKRVGKDH